MTVVVNSKLIRKAILLSYFTIAYNLIEGIVSIAFGISDEAISLAGFGGDSLIEVASAFLVLWRFQGELSRDPSHSVKREKRATFGIGLLFLLLTIITAVVATLKLWQHTGPETTLPGVIIALLSLSFMFFLWNAKKKLALKLNSATIWSDARCSLACIKLSFVLLLGSGIFFLFPQLWWADSAAAWVILILIGQEGIEMIRASRHEGFTGGCC